MHRFGVKIQFCPFPRKRDFWGSNSNGVNIKVVGSDITNQNKSKSEYFEIKDKSPHGHASPEPPQARSN